MNKLLYFDSGLHIEPVIYFPEIKEFIFVDTLPRSDADSDKFDYSNYNFNFYFKLITKCSYFGFKLISENTLDPIYYHKLFTFSQELWYYYDVPEYINPTKLVFQNENTNQIIIYYISCNVLFNKNSGFLQDIKTSDTLFVSRYFPSIEILDYFDKPKNFIKYNSGYTPEPDSILDILSHPKNFCYFSNYYTYFQELIKCKNINEISLIEMV